MKMNGWQRLWVVASVCWAAFWLYRIAEGIWKFGFGEKDFALVVAILLCIAVIPPIGIYTAAIGLLLVYRWVAAGFKA